MIYYDPIADVEETADVTRNVQRMTSDPVYEKEQAVSDTPKLYAERRPMELEPYYSAHMLAMTVENLRGKSEIAEELAFRDKRIAELEAALRSNAESAMRAHGASFDDLRICGNCNGSGYTA